MKLQKGEVLELPFLGYFDPKYVFSKTLKVMLPTEYPTGYWQARRTSFEYLVKPNEPIILIKQCTYDWHRYFFLPLIPLAEGRIPKNALSKWTSNRVFATSAIPSLYLAEVEPWKSN